MTGEVSLHNQLLPHLRCCTTDAGWNRKGLVIYMELENKAEELSEMLVNSDIYRTYVEARSRLEENEDIFKKVNEYRKKNFVIQNEIADNKVEQLRNLEHEYKDILKNTIVRDFLNSELVLCRTIKKINEIIIDKIDMNIDFLD